jgi:hypothetical protein
MCVTCGCACDHDNSIDPITNCTDCNPPAEACDGGEPCEKALPGSCTFYEGPDLACSGIENGDSVEAAIQKIDEKLCSTPGTFIQEDTNTINLSGVGTQASPLKGDVKIDPDTDNIVYATSNGIIAKITVDVINKLLLLISTTPALNTLFCSLVQSCGAASCNLSTDLDVSMEDPDPSPTCAGYIDIGTITQQPAQTQLHIQLIPTVNLIGFEYILDNDAPVLLNYPYTAGQTINFYTTLPAAGNHTIKVRGICGSSSFTDYTTESITVP